jgi:hypothetical protein
MLPNNCFNPWKTKGPHILKHMRLFIKPLWFLFKRLNNPTSSFPFFLFSGLLLKLRLIVLLETTCILDATWGNKFEVTSSSSLKNNLNLKFFRTWRGAMALGNPRMNVEYKCNTQKHKEQDKMTRMKGKKRA